MVILEVLALSATAILATFGMQVAAELMGEEQAIRELDGLVEEAR